VDSGLRSEPFTPRCQGYSQPGGHCSARQPYRHIHRPMHADRYPAETGDDGQQDQECPQPRGANGVDPDAEEGRRRHCVSGREAALPETRADEVEGPRLQHCRWAQSGEQGLEGIGKGHGEECGADEGPEDARTTAREEQGQGKSNPFVAEHREPLPKRLGKLGRQGIEPGEAAVIAASQKQDQTDQYTEHRPTGQPQAAVRKGCRSASKARRQALTQVAPEKDGKTLSHRVAAPLL